MEGTSNPPSLEEIRNTRHWAFQIEAGTAELQEAIGKQIQRLSAEFPEWKFSAWFQSIARRVSTTPPLPAFARLAQRPGSICADVTKKLAL